MRKELTGGITVEAALLIPVILFVFGVLLHALFYYHDKNVVKAVTCDTTSYGSYLKEPEQAALKQYFDEQLSGKLLLFQEVFPDIQISEREIKVSCKSREKGMLIQTECAVTRTEPFYYIRQLRKIKKLSEEVQK